jgi:hypothetical protein
MLVRYMYLAFLNIKGLQRLALSRFQARNIWMARRQEESIA